jgi:hypothetical protein
MRLGVLLVVTGGTAAVFACGASEPQLPPYTPQPTSALTEVPFPPPPARIEVVPSSPQSETVWIDGEWTWQMRRWAWKPGRWVKPPENARFSPWTTVRDRLGTLYFAGGTWRNASGSAIDEPPPLAVAGRAPAMVVTPDGDPVPSGPMVPLGGLDAGDRGRGGPSAIVELDASAFTTSGDGGATP